MAWSDHINTRPQYWGAPDLVDGHSRIAEAMGGLADDDCVDRPPTSALVEIDEQDRGHEAMVGMCRADDF